MLSEDYVSLTFFYFFNREMTHCKNLPEHVCNLTWFLGILFGNLHQNYNSRLTIFYKF